MSSVREIPTYLLSLRYPGTSATTQSLVCYNSQIQVIVPLLPAGRSIIYTTKPPPGVYAMIGHWAKFGSDLLPNSGRVTAEHFGIMNVNEVCSQLIIETEREALTVITEQMPLTYTITNLSPLAQRVEMVGYVVIIPTVDDMKIVMDALRRLHTSKEAESLLQQASYQLSLISGHPEEPRPPLGGS